MAQQKPGVWPGRTMPYFAMHARKWARSGLTYGAAGFLTLTYFTDWKAVLIYVPYINRQWTKKVE
ncbi:Ubiquinol-cytochrome C reductase complex, 6.4kD protein [Tyrophagus putrescentiae]|nr:Ubiquinol-cytochrome C reductase complex, 6.4kD protein [Tyrophagus putrescentiae]KAH9392754.1 Ubiquinol-cytochrome C reductase complex, 6.4kD protein [Tyrophagus putrescentiae]